MSLSASQETGKDAFAAVRLMSVQLVVIFTYHTALRTNFEKGWQILFQVFFCQNSPQFLAAQVFYCMVYITAQK